MALDTTVTTARMERLMVLRVVRNPGQLPNLTEDSQGLKRQAAENRKGTHFLLVAERSHTQGVINGGLQACYGPGGKNPEPLGVDTGLGKLNQCVPEPGKTVVLGRAHVLTQVERKEEGSPKHKVWEGAGREEN